MDAKRLSNLQLELNEVLDVLATSEGQERKALRKEGERLFDEIDLILSSAQNELWTYRKLLGVD